MQRHPLLLSVGATEYTELQPLHSGVHSVMRVKSVLAGEGVGCTPTPSHYIYQHQQSCSVRSSWVGRYTDPISSLPTYVLFGRSFALQRQNTEISKQIFPEKEYRGLSPNFHIHAPVSELYISTIGLSILLEEICRVFLGKYKSLTETWMLKLGLRPRYSQKRNT